MLASGKQQCLCWQLPNVRFLYIILHMAINFQGTNINVLLLATIDREKYRIIPYPSMSKAGSKGMAGMVMAIPIFCVFYWTSQSHFQGACNIHARSNLVELRSFVSTGEHGLL